MFKKHWPRKILDDKNEFFRLSNERKRRRVKVKKKKCCWQVVLKYGTGSRYRPVSLRSL